MTRDEAIGVLFVMTSAWPWIEMTDGNVEVWLENLADMDPTHGLEAARLLVKELERMPTIARFRETARSCARSALARQESPTLPSGALLTDRSTALERVAQLRRELAAIPPPVPVVNR